MKIIEIHTQQEFDAVPKTFDELTELRIVSGSIVVKEAYNSARVVARGSASVVARDSARVVAYNSARVEAWGSASVVARGSAVTIAGLFFWSTLVMHFCVCKIIKKHKTAKIIRQTRGVITKKEFLKTLEKSGRGYVLYKIVNPETLCDFRTGKIKYSGVVICPDWNPDPSLECGGGLHLSPRPDMALSYNRGKVLRCRVRAEDMVLYQPGDFTKVRCREVEVLGEYK